MADKRVRLVLTRAQFLKVIDRVRELAPDIAKFKTIADLAESLTRELGFGVTRHHADEALELTGLKIPNAGRAPRGTGAVRENNKLRYIARELNRLRIRLGEGPSDALVQIGMGYMPAGIDDE